MWPMACLTDPKFSEQRMELIKPLSLVYIIDDIFDVYGSPDELALFTDVVNRWDLEAAEKLPQHLRICFNALHGITNEFAQKVYLKHGCYPLNTLRKLWVQLCNAFLVEAKWFASGHVPSTEEYLKNGMISSGVHVVLGHTWFLLNHDITTQTGGIMNDTHGLVSSVASILRLSDDLQGYMEDDQNGHDGSYVECYMKQHRGISAEETRQHVSHMISGSWKRLNQECLAPFRFSSTFKKVCLNTARMVRRMYNSDGNHCFLDRENLMSYLL
ncbi:(3S,6E)-nerolidol synthase 1-like [Neltuma alba]|uniref:(3S,6E)-nerolidol synthase 1-like n=1 Tax=Neltuma alba TaxID=207710 RepID=UPI0010A3FD5F|nr:(3S,6E)-nerolidol synthase 1-like [Prosopis alba]XP_028805331.1 (3S,6E)-nerolidol synthase 1-like [Prosopis alba]